MRSAPRRSGTAAREYGEAARSGYEHVFSRHPLPASPPYMVVTTATQPREIQAAHGRRHPIALDQAVDAIRGQFGIRSWRECDERAHDFVSA